MNGMVVGLLVLFYALDLLPCLEAAARSMYRRDTKLAFLVVGGFVIAW